MHKLYTGTIQVTASANKTSNRSVDLSCTVEVPIVEVDLTSYCRKVTGSGSSCNEDYDSPTVRDFVKDNEVVLEYYYSCVKGGYYGGSFGCGSGWVNVSNAEEFLNTKICQYKRLSGTQNDRYFSYCRTNSIDKIKVEIKQ